MLQRLGPSVKLCDPNKPCIKISFGHLGLKSFVPVLFVCRRVESCARLSAAWTLLALYLHHVNTFQYRGQLDKKNNNDRILDQKIFRKQKTHGRFWKLKFKKTCGDFSCLKIVQCKGNSFCFIQKNNLLSI